jgi:hypothetical protein
MNGFVLAAVIIVVLFAVLLVLKIRASRKKSAEIAPVEQAETDTLHPPESQMRNPTRLQQQMNLPSARMLSISMRPQYWLSRKRTWCLPNRNRLPPCPAKMEAAMRRILLQWVRGARSF